MVSAAAPKIRIALPPDGPLMTTCRIARGPRQVLGGGSEDSDQRRLARLLDARGYLWAHPPNEAKRSERERGAALARGLKKGVPDIMIYRPFDSDGVHYAGLAAELKRSDATACCVEDDQRRWLCCLRIGGWMAEWCRGYDEAARLIQRAYGGG